MRWYSCWYGWATVNRLDAGSIPATAARHTRRLHRVPIKSRARSVEVFISELIEWASVFCIRSHENIGHYCALLCKRGFWKNHTYGRTSQWVMATVSKTAERPQGCLEGSTPFLSASKKCVSDRAVRYRVSILARRVRLPRDTLNINAG